MLATRDQSRRDTSVATLTEAILERDQPRTAELFFRMVRREGRAVSDALGVVTEAEAPFVQVPSHINARWQHHPHQQRPHLGCARRRPAPFLPSRIAAAAPAGVWYIPAGLDIWNQPRALPGPLRHQKGFEVRLRAGAGRVERGSRPIAEGGMVVERLHAH
jgi:hypothetical protein